MNYPNIAKDPKLKEFCTPRQAEILDLVAVSETIRGAEREAGVANAVFRSAVKAVLKKAALAGYSPATGFHDQTAMPGFTLKRRSTARNSSGDIVLDWNIQEQDKTEAWKQMKEAIEGLADGLTPFDTAPGVRTTERNQDLLTKYVLTDYHYGMYAWGEETGSDWDVHIAEKTFLHGFQDMMHGSPDSKEAIFMQLGDFLHWDGMEAVTPTAHNVLDADSRFPLMVRMALESTLKAIEMLTHKHEKVHVIMAEGNHDMASSVWLRAIISKMFEGFDNVTVEDSPIPYYHYSFGDNFLGCHHGHLLKMEKLITYFATDPSFSSAFGNARYRYIDTGHLHHEKVLIDIGGVVTEQHPTLSARDAYAARKFLNAQRGAKATTYHRTEGEYTRVTVRPRTGARRITE